MPTNPFLALMTAARTHAEAHGAPTPVLSPFDATLLGDNPPVDVTQLHHAGFRVVPWTTNDPAKMRALLHLRVDGIITDRPDILQAVLKEEAAADAAYFAGFDVAAHRGGRGLRPENTLPSFENGLDHLATTLETDTGVTTDHVSMIWHDQFLDPQSCRHADGTPYTLENRTYIRDISSTEAQRTFICDKLRTGSYPPGVQTNDLSLSPVAVAFAKQEHLINPYVPTQVEQLFRFVAFYTDYYATGPGKSNPEAATRAANAAKVRFNIETKILPLPNDPAGNSVASLPVPIPGEEPTTNHTVDPQTFVTTLCGIVMRNHMEGRSEVQSFDFRTLQLVEEQYPKIPTYYLTESPETLSTEFVPSSLRQP
ncbi:glycerophosphodiester phosphodiesterase family protein [Edaphobacter sp. DSM 109919]|uniref:Glycerophosphodiester phosphodiesterase family protein n=1 Tax=Edaphobacter paludis TaxID=3035702 RepID=A0AAU7CXX3_9BACT